MATFTKHILEASKRIYKKEFIFPEDTTPPPDVEIYLPKISISNDNMVFSMSAEHVISIMLKDGSPVYVSDASDLIKLKLLSVRDGAIVEMLENSSGNIDNFLDVVSKNSQKIHQIDIPYNNRGILEENKIISTGESHFPQIPLSGKDNPDDLSLFYMLILESGTRKTLISQVNRQSIFSSGKLILSSNILDQRTKKLDDYLNFEIINQVKENKEAYFSDQFMSLDPSGFIKFLFMFDKIQFLQEKSLFGGVLKDGTTDTAMKSIIEKSQITDLRIIKSRVKKNIDGFSRFSKNQKYEVVISSADDDSGSLLYRERINPKNSEIQGKIVELPGVKNSQNFKTYAVNDYSPLKIKNGKYRYSISMRIRDGILLYLLDSVEILTKAKKDLLIYQKQQVSPNLETMSQAKKSVEDILSVLFSMKKMNDSQKQETTNDFEMMFRFFEGRENIINFSSDLIDKINYALSTRGLSNINSKSASYTKNTSNLFVIEYNQKFGEIVDFSELIGEKTQFIEKVDSENIGATVYTESIIRNRFMEEFKKIINFAGDYEEINFPTFTMNLVESVRNANLEEEVLSTIFDFKSRFYSYLSPMVIVDESKKIKNKNFSLNSYNPSDKNALNSLSEKLAEKGVRILTPVEREQAAQSENSLAICSDKIFGQQDIINTEKTYNENSDISSEKREKQHYQAKYESYPFSNGVRKYYNNFNLKRQDYNLSSPDNIIINKINQESDQLTMPELEDMPNQIRSLFISNSDIVKNKWNLTESDFFVNPMSSEMMRENYSNLIKIEILSDFVKDASNMKNIKSPSFKPLEVTDIQNLQPGQSLLCRTKMISDYSLGIGQRQKSMKEPIYYNKYFILIRDND